MPNASPRREWTRRFAAAPAVLALILALSRPAALGGDAAAGPDGARPVIGFIIPTLDDSWWLRLWMGAVQSARANGFTLLRSEAGNTRKVLDNVRGLYVRGGRAIIIGTAEGFQGRTVLNECRRLGLKVYAVGYRLEEEDGGVIGGIPFSGADVRRAGHDAAAAMTTEAHRRGWAWDDTLAAIFRSNYSHASDYADALADGLAKNGFPRDRILDVHLSPRDYIGAMIESGLVADSHPGTGNWMIGGAQDAAVIGAVRALEERGYDRNSILAIGANAGFDARREFENPNPTGFFGSIRLSGVVQGRRIADRVFRWIRDGEAPAGKAADDLLVGSLVTRDNYVEKMWVRHVPGEEFYVRETEKTDSE